VFLLYKASSSAQSYFSYSKVFSSTTYKSEVSVIKAANYSNLAAMLVNLASKIPT